MCGRFTLTNPIQIPLRFDLGVEVTGLPEPQFNVAPSQQIPTIMTMSDKRLLQSMRWGLQVGRQQAKSRMPPPINARAETLLDRPLFRPLLAHNRCLIPADGFFEWQDQPGKKTKQPVYARLKSRELFAFAGLYAQQHDESGALQLSCTLITTAPNELMAPIHSRMPAILLPEGERAWLDPELTMPEALLEYLRPYPAEQMEAFGVSNLVSSVRNNGSSLIQPLVND